MKRALIRSTLFNIAFYAVNLVACIGLMPTILLPRKYYMACTRPYHHILTILEYTILGLRYEVRGLEHVPKEGSFLVAAKHMSAYETFKLQLMFKDPAIILKKELLRIPFWGAHLKKSDVIAIDRSTPEKALRSIEDGAVRMRDQGRPIVIFPQGTRVNPDETTKDKPYKAGIYRIQKATDLPIIPMATNSGLFWPRSSWLKSSGAVIFEFMPAIEAGKNKPDLMKTLEEKLETTSLSLMNEAKMRDVDRKKPTLIFALLFLILIGGLYSYVWFESAKTVRTAYINFVSDIGRTSFITEPKISGFPGPIKLDVLGEAFENEDLAFSVKIIHAEGWPLPFAPIFIRTGPIYILATKKWAAPIQFEGLSAKFTMNSKNVIKIFNSTLTKDGFAIDLSGTVDLKQKPIPKMELLLSLKNHQQFIMALAEKKILRQQMAMFMGAGFTTLADADGIVRVPLSQRGRKLYAGPLPIADLPEVYIQEESQGELPRLEPYIQLGPDQ